MSGTPDEFLLQDKGLSPCNLAEWMYNQGLTVMEWDGRYTNASGEVDLYAMMADGVSPADIQPGDIVFFSEKWNDVYVSYGFKHISHVAIITSGHAQKVYHSNFGNPYSSYEYDHEILEVVSKTYAYWKSGVINAHSDSVSDYQCDAIQKRSLWVNPYQQEAGSEDTFVLGWAGSMVLVCRPKLLEAGVDNSLKAEAQKLGMHKVPRSWNVLNQIKRARQLTDIKWTPAVDMPRKSVYAYMTSDTYPMYGWNVAFGTYENAKFKAGVEYTGVPVVDSDYIIGRNYSLDSFASSVGYSESSAGKGLVGIDCDSFIEYVCGYNSWYGSPINAYALEVGAIWYGDGDRSCIITDIIDDSDADNSISFYPLGDYSFYNEEMMIEVAEASGEGCVSSLLKDEQDGGVVRRYLMTLGEFESKYHYGEGIYDDYTEYHPSKYVDIENSLRSTKAEPLPLVPVNGNKCFYYAWELGTEWDGNVPIRILDSQNYTHAVLYSDFRSGAGYDRWQVINIAENIDQNGIITFTNIPAYPDVYESLIRVYLAKYENYGQPDQTVEVNPLGCEFTVIGNPYIRHIEDDETGTSLMQLVSYSFRPHSVWWQDEEYHGEYVINSYYNEEYEGTGYTTRLDVFSFRVEFGTDRPESVKLTMTDEQEGHCIDIPIELSWSPSAS